MNDESSRADVNVAKEFLKVLNKLMAKENNLPEQLLSVNETSLFWKQIPERISSIRRPSFKAFKDRIIVFLGGNSAGYKLKPSVT